MPKPAPLPTLLDRLTPDAVYGAFAEPAFAEGRDAVERGRVSRPDVRPARAEAVVVGADRRSHRARLALVDDEVTSSCTCGAKRCGHAAALGLILLGEAPMRPRCWRVRRPACRRSADLRHRTPRADESQGDADGPRALAGALRRRLPDVPRHRAVRAAARSGREVPLREPGLGGGAARARGAWAPGRARQNDRARGGSARLPALRRSLPDPEPALGAHSRPRRCARAPAAGPRPRLRCVRSAPLPALWPGGAVPPGRAGVPGPLQARRPARGPKSTSRT
jgi:hypothetical protein